MAKSSINWSDTLFLESSLATEVRNDHFENTTAGSQIAHHGTKQHGKIVH